MDGKAEQKRFAIAIWPGRFTSLSLLFLSPRTRSVRFLSNSRWKFPFTCFRFSDIFQSKQISLLSLCSTIAQTGVGEVFATPKGSSYNEHSDTAFTFLRKLESYGFSGNMFVSDSCRLLNFNSILNLGGFMLLFVTEFF